MFSQKQQKGKNKSQGAAADALPASIDDEASLLFPSLKPEMTEPKLRPPEEYLGRNPFSELRRRAEHTRNLAALDANSQQKIREAQELLASRRAATDSLLHATPLSLTPEELEAANDRGASLLLSHVDTSSRPLPPLRAVPSTATNNAPCLAASTSTSTSLAASPSIFFSSSGAQAGKTVWGPEEAISVDPPLITLEDAKSSRSQFLKHKVQKHRNYFGRVTLSPSVDAKNDDEQETPARQILEFSAEVERLLALHPTVPSIEALTNATFILDAFTVVDAAGLTYLFGKQSISLIRTNGAIVRDVELCPKGGSPSADPPAYLPHLRLSAVGKVQGHWPGDVVQVETYLSRYAYTPKSVQLVTSCKRFPNVFSRFGVDTIALDGLAPFSLRLPEECVSSAQDVTQLVLFYHCKTQLRVLSASFSLHLFQGFISADAVLTVSGHLPKQVDSEEDEEERVGQQQQERAAITTADNLHIDLKMTIPNHVDNFYFRAASPFLAFMDDVDCVNRVFRAVMVQPRDWEEEKDVAKDEDSLQNNNNRLEIEFDWNTSRMPLLQKLFDGDLQVHMKGWLQRASRRFTAFSQTPSTRSCLLWNFIKLKNIVAFVDCEEGVSECGVECTVEMTLQPPSSSTDREVANGGGGGAQVIEFRGKLSTVVTQAAKTATAFSSASSNNDTGRTTTTWFRFEGNLTEGAWNSIAGLPFVHLKSPKLEFTVDGDTLLPGYFVVLGTPVFQTAAEKGMGCTSDHATRWFNGRVDFPVDAFPEFLLTATVPLKEAKKSDGMVGRCGSASLKEVCMPLLLPDTNLWVSEGSSAGGADFHLHQLMQGWEAIVLHDATLVVNSSRSELTDPTLMRRFEPGCLVDIREGSLHVFGPSNSFPVRGQLSFFCISSDRMAIQGRLTALNHVTQPSLGMTWSSTVLSGQGPSWDVLFEWNVGGSATTSCANVVCRIVPAPGSAVVNVHRLGSITIAKGDGEDNIAPKSGVALPHPSSIPDSALDALLVPPEVLLENEPKKLANANATWTAWSHSIRLACSQYYTLPLRTHIMCGTNCQGSSSKLLPCMDVSLPKASTMTSNEKPGGVKWGLLEAVWDVANGKVAELRAALTGKALALEKRHADIAAELARFDEEHFGLRIPEINAMNHDSLSLQQAITSLSAESSKLSQRWMGEAAPADATSSGDTPGVSSSLNNSAVNGIFPQAVEAQLHALHHTLPGTPSTAARKARHAVIASCISQLSFSVDHAVKTSFSLGHCVERAPSLDHGPLGLHLSTSGRQRLLDALHESNETTEDLRVIATQLEADERIFPTLLSLESVRLDGGSSFASSQQDSPVPSPHIPVQLFLVATGTVRRHRFQIFHPLSPLTHTAMVLAIDVLTTEILQLYVQHMTQE